MKQFNVIYISGEISYFHVLGDIIGAEFILSAEPALYFLLSLLKALKVSGNHLSTLILFLTAGLPCVMRYKTNLIHFCGVSRCVAEEDEKKTVRTPLTTHVEKWKLHFPRRVFRFTISDSLYI